MGEIQQIKCKGRKEGRKGRRDKERKGLEREGKGEERKEEERKGEEGKGRERKGEEESGEKRIMYSFPRKHWYLSVLLQSAHQKHPPLPLQKMKRL